MSQSPFDPTSTDKLEGSNTDLASLIPFLTGGATPEMSAQEGLRMPLSPRPIRGAGRPEEPLIDAKPLQYSPRSDEDMLALARQSFSNAESYFNANHRSRIMDAMARFNSEHPKGSKYWTPAFEKRSKLFRPKTRSTIRKREAAAAISLFASADIVNISATSGDPGAALDARVQQELLNYRINEDKRWYVFTVGAVQDADRQGFAIAKTYWDYDESNRYYDELHPELGPIKRVDTVASVDRPGFKLIPIENFLFSPAADWMDVVASSPYIIEIMPMYVCDVLRYMSNPNARLKYNKLTPQQLMAGGTAAQWDSIRLQRERNAQSRFDRNGEVSDYAICWVHRNIMRIDGEDYIYDTVGTELMLSNVIPLSEFDPRGYRGYIVGSTMIESHNPYNAGTATLMAPMQDEITDTANLRQDANKMATAGRTFVKRNTGLDLRAMARFAPGAVVELENPNTDVKWDRAPEAPRGSMEEHQLMNVELDDLVGNFSQASVSNNRNLNETVGGMQMLGDSANQLTEYDLHTFCTTFLQEVLGQLLDLLKQWETDRTLATIIGTKLAVSAKQFWQALGTESKVTVNVGFGATNPAKRIERTELVLSTIAKFFPMQLMKSDQDEFMKDLFAAAGYSDISRYFPMMDQKQSNDPQIQALQQQVEQLQMLTYPQQAHIQGVQAVATIRAQAAERIASIASNTQLTNKNAELQLAYIELQLEKEKNEIARGNLMMAREKLSNDIAIQRSEFLLQQATAMASPNPPVVAPPDGGPQPQQLALPDSNVTLPNFQQDVQSAGGYANANGGQAGPNNGMPGQ